MAKKMTPSQYRAAVNKYNSTVRKIYADRKRKIDAYNREVKKHNAEVNRSIDNYNREVRKYNAAQRARRQNLNNAINQYNQSRIVVSSRTTIEYSNTTNTLNQRYKALDSYTDSIPDTINEDLLINFPERETNNSIVLFNAITGVQDGETLPPETLQRTVIESALYELSDELGKRWEGAIFSLNPENPDAARHFCTSVREILINVLDIKAPNDHVQSELPDCTFYEGRPDRRSKIKFLLMLKSISVDYLTDFIESDIDNLLELFRTLSSATHGSAGKFDIQQLLKLKKRVEDSIIFMTSIISEK